MASTTYRGILENFYNTVPANMPPEFRNEAAYITFKYYDNQYRPVLEELFNRVIAKDDKGNMVTYDDKFKILTSADPGTMSRWMDRRERIRPDATALDEEQFTARLTRSAGPEVDRTKFNNSWKAGILDAVYADQTEGALKKISRKIEYELCGYTKGNATSIQQFSNQSTARLKTFDCTTGDPTSGSYLSGAAWDNWSSDPKHDVGKINLYAEAMGGMSIDRGYIGSNTAFALSNNAKLIDYAKYNVDITNKPLGLSINGIPLKTVTTLFTKDASTNVARLGYPGLGDVRPDDWTTRKKIHFMTELVGTTRYEFAIFTAGKIGNLHCAYTHPNHKDPTVPYYHSWPDEEFELMKTSVDFAFTPEVTDFGRIVIVDKVATWNV